MEEEACDKDLSRGEEPLLISVDDHRHPVVSHSNVLINVRRALVPLVAVRALEPRLLPAVVLHVGLQGLLVGVAGVAARTVVRHLAGLPERSVFVLDLVPAAAIVRPQDVQYAGVVAGPQQPRRSYEQEENAGRG